MRSMVPHDRAPYLGPGRGARARRARAAAALRPHRHPVRPRARAVAEHAGPARARRACSSRSCSRSGSPTPRRTTNGFVTATLPGNVAGAPVIGLLAHLDTSPDEPGTRRRAARAPRLRRRRDRAARAAARVLDPERMPELAAQASATTSSRTSGDTLLGADDKAGVAEVMAAVAHLAAHPELPRPTIRVGFTPDEEIGRGRDALRHRGASARRAPTRSTAPRSGELQDETFTAAAAELTIDGRRRPSRLRHRQARQRRRGSPGACSRRCRRTG